MLKTKIASIHPLTLLSVKIFLYLLKRLGAYYYKTNRHFYELHKCCCFKFGCTLIIVMIQIFCNKKYKCQKANESKLSIETNSSSDEQSNNKTNEKKKKKRRTKKPSHISIKMEKRESSDHNKRVSIEKDLHDSVIIGQPTSCFPSTCQHTNFPTISNSQFSPSFNLKTNQKSTPANCSCCQKHVVFQNVPNSTIFSERNGTNVNFENTQTQTRSQTNPVHSTPKQTHTRADIHESPQNVSDSQNNESFQSC